VLAFRTEWEDFAQPTRVTKVSAPSASTTNLMNAFFQSFAWMAPFYLPPIIVLLWLYRVKQAHENRARQPFTEQPLRLAGESTRDKADELFGDAFAELLFILLLCPLAGLVFLQVPSHNRAATVTLGFVAVSVIAGIGAFRVCKKLKESWQYRLGSKGEQVVGRELDRLIAQGYQVFHDMPFVGWNIDHVVVGPEGVFAIETKAWRKPAKSKDLKAEIVLDGDILLLPGQRINRTAIEEAARNARSLQKWIAKVSAVQAVVVGVVALPGWSLFLKRYGDVAVFSATNMSEKLPKCGRTKLSPEQIKRIAAQVENQCTVGATPINHY
jgi:hypothetical protein